jgi:hypothetical protein
MAMIHLYHTARLIVVFTLLGLAGPAHAELFPRPCGPLGARPAASPKAAMICAVMPAVNHAV